MDGTTDVALGLVVDGDGWVVTKRTLVQGRKDLRCRLFYTNDGNVMQQAHIAVTSVPYDLALLKIDVRNQPSAQWAKDPVRVGQCVVSLSDLAAEPLQVAVAGSEIRAEQTPPGDIAQLFLDVKAGLNGEATISGDQTLHQSTPETDGFRYAFQAGDVITRLNDISIPTFQAFNDAQMKMIYASASSGKYDTTRGAMNSYAGESVSVTVRRNGQEVLVDVIKAHSHSPAPLFWYKTPLSIPLCATLG